MSCPVCDYKIAKQENYESNENSKHYFQVVFMLTDDCNFRCNYCFEQHKNSTYMTKEIAKTFIDKMFDFKDYKDYWNYYFNENDELDYIGFKFFGGEPFLNVDVMEFIISYFTFKCNEDLSKYSKRLENFRCDIVTNGSLLNTIKSQEFLDKYIDKLDVHITFEGVQAYHDSCRFFKGTKKGTYQTVLENIKWYTKRYNRKIQSKVTITPLNVSYLYEAFCSLRELGEEQIYMEFQDDTDLWNSKHVEIADSQYKLIVNDLLKHPNTIFVPFFIYDTPSIKSILFKGCAIGRNYITLEANGDFYPCYRFSNITVDEEISSKYLIGNYKDGIFKKSKSTLDEIWKWTPEKKYVDNDCKMCLLPTHCNDCAASNLQFNGDLDKSLKWSCELLKTEHKWALIYNYYKEIGKDEVK